MFIYIIFDIFNNNDHNLIKANLKYVSIIFCQVTFHNICTNKHYNLNIKSHYKLYKAIYKTVINII